MGKIVGIAVIAGMTIAVGYMYVRFHSLTAWSAKRQGGKPYTEGERALLLIPLLAGIIGTILLVIAAVRNG